jgi:N-acetylated-alpha-linked acidic dipeptidase
MLASVDGILALRLANADILPYDVARYAEDTRTHVQTLLDVAEARRVEVDLSALVAATAALDAAAAGLEAARAERVAAGPLSPAEAIRVNTAMIGLEKAWLDDRGLQDREWSRSLYVSPDPFSGYASWMLPGLRYEIETDDPAEVPEWERRYLDAVERLARGMTEATEVIRGTMP